MRIQWKVWLCILAACGLGTISARAQILTTEDLVRAGITRLSDILELADDWVGSSTEGYHWAMAPLGTSWEASPDWSLYIDGQPVNIQVLNHQSLNVLPLAISEICEVHLHSTPTLINGTIASGGAIDLIRCTPTKGISLKGMFSAGNETGDPGPYKYTAIGGTNVDRTGPTVHGSAAVASQKWYLRVTAGTDEHHSTNPRIRPRVLQLYQGEKDARILQRFLGVESELLNHRLSAGISQVDDLVFLPIMGREIPLKQEVIVASATFSHGRFGYSVSGSSIAFSPREDSDPPSIDLAQRQIMVRAYGISSVFGKSQLEYGISATGSEAHFGLGQMGTRLGSFKLYTVIQPDLLFDLRMNAMAALTRDDGVIGYEIFAHTSHTKTGLDLRLMLRDRSVASQMNFRSWTERGNRLPGVEIRSLSSESSQRESIYSADLAWSTGTRVKFALSVGLRSLNHAIRPFTESTLDSTRISLRAVTNMVSTRGNIARTSLEVTHYLSEQFTLSVHSTYAYPWSTMHAFRSAWYHRMLLGFRGEFQPNDRFSLDLRLRYTGSSVWHEYEEASRDTPEFYAMHLPGAVHLHLTIQKRFWKDHLRMSATMRNILDHPHLTHPAGAKTRALFQVAVQYAL